MPKKPPNKWLEAIKLAFVVIVLVLVNLVKLLKLIKLVRPANLIKLANLLKSITLTELSRLIEQAKKILEPRQPDPVEGFITDLFAGLVLIGLLMGLLAGAGLVVGMYFLVEAFI